jgi:Na+(H+)/acetate symporter ActP
MKMLTRNASTHSTMSAAKQKRNRRRKKGVRNPQKDAAIMTAAVIRVRKTTVAIVAAVAMTSVLAVKAVATLLIIDDASTKVRNRSTQSVVNWQQMILLQNQQLC